MRQCVRPQGVSANTLLMVSAPPAVLVDGVFKTFRIPREQVHTLKERALHPFRRAGHDDLRALRDVSFAVERGEFLAVVGESGSGKTAAARAVLGLLPSGLRQAGGRIVLDGIDLARVSAR